MSLKSGLSLLKISESLLKPINSIALEILQQSSESFAAVFNKSAVSVTSFVMRLTIFFYRAPLLLIPWKALRVLLQKQVL